jgi:hypothetical protein
MSETTVHPQWVTHQDVRDAREGRIPSELHEATQTRAKCAQCRKVIIERERLLVVIPGLAWPSYLHRSETTCNANIEAATMARKHTWLSNSKPRRRS